MCSAGVLFFVIGLWAAKRGVSEERGVEKVLAVGNLCFALPLGVFGGLHLSAARGLMTMVPDFIPWHLFWAYFVGFALLAASLSIATKNQVQWSGLLLGCMMFIFVATMDIPGAITEPRNRISWVLLFREMSFGGGGWILAGEALSGSANHGKSKLITIGRIILGFTAIFYGVQHFLHPFNVPGVPLEKLMPAYFPARLIAYLTGAILLVAGVCILLAKKTRTAATYLGAWLLLLVIFVYGPILITSLLAPGTDIKVEGLNYFFDTLLFAGAVLALGHAAPRSDFSGAAQPYAQLQGSSS